MEIDPSRSLGLKLQTNRSIVSFFLLEDGNKIMGNSINGWEDLQQEERRWWTPSSCQRTALSAADLLTPKKLFPKSQICPGNPF